MSFKYYLSRVLSLLPHVVAQKVARRARQEIKQRQKRRLDLRCQTYEDRYPFGKAPLNCFLSSMQASLFSAFDDSIAVLANRYLNHQFDLLGSGCVNVRHGVSCAGLEESNYSAGLAIAPGADERWLASCINRANLGESQRILSLIDLEYRPIDWHLDFKSGYRWPESTRYPEILYAHKPGVDIKVPWELTRMQHLPQLAWAYALAQEQDQSSQDKFAKSQVYAGEFRNQVLDFIATNPPRFGVNWRCTMDVGIRVANWLLTYDIFKAFGAQFDDEFENVFKRSIYEHGLYIINNLEWSQELRSNHYLSDIAGLLFVAAYLPRSPEVDVWLAFAVQELINEAKTQFNEDGSNFEASTSYHRLSSELVTYVTALVLTLPENKLEALQQYDHRLHEVKPGLKPAPLLLYPLPGSGKSTPFPDWYFKRLEKMAEFTMDISGLDKRICQIGDNDSGRFLKLRPSYQQLTIAEAKATYLNLKGYSGSSDDEPYLVEDSLDHRHLVAAINGFFKRKDFAGFAGEMALETDIVGNLISGATVRSYRHGSKEPAASQRDDGVTLCSYPDFGLYVYKSKRIHLVVRCGPNGQNGNGGHAHNDQLSIVLSVDGEPVLVDSGTYLYTPAPEKRNLFRSTAMHNTLAVEGKEQNSWLEGTVGLFSMKDQARASVREVNRDRFIGEHTGFGVPHRRTLGITETCIVGLDECKTDAQKALYFHLAPAIQAIVSAAGGSVELSAGNVRLSLMGGPVEWHLQEGFYSPAYGLLQKDQVVELKTTAQKISWRIELKLSDKE